MGDRLDAETSRERLRYARAVAKVWQDAGISDHLAGGYGAMISHPMAMVLLALDGETDPEELGCDAGKLAAALEAADD